MEKSKSQLSRWQHWLSFSAFTLAGVAMEGSVPPKTGNPLPKAKKWRSQKSLYSQAGG